MATDHNIRQLVINKMTDAQYEQAVKSADELYLTPDSGSGGSSLPDQTGQAGKFLTTDGSTASWGNVPAGTVTSVRVQATSPVQSSTSTAQSTSLNTTISLANNYGDTKNPYASKTKNYVLAAPVSANGTPSFRALDKADIPLASETAASGGTTTSLVTTGEKYTWNNKQDTISDLSTIRDGASAGATAVQPGDLATVATSGSYNDLTNKPTIPVITDTYSATSSNGMSGKAVASAISNKADKATSLSGYGITDAYTKTEVDGMISSVYKPAGSVAFASLPTLSDNVLGNVYNVTDAFTTTTDFVEGSGKSYPAGTNVVVVNTGTSSSPTYKFDVLSGFVDLSGYVPTSRKVNGKALSADITLSASDVGALPDNTTIPQGTVTSVRVQAGTGLSSSVSTAQTTSLDTTISIASGYKLPTTTEWGNKQDALTTQTAYTSKGTATKVPQITTNTLGQVTGITEVDITQPTVNNSTILLTQGGVNKGSFTLNQATDSIIDFDKSGAELIIVDNSGSTLPTPQTIGETFLNTTDKKIYTGEAGEYVVGTNIVKNGDLDLSNGEMDNFSSTNYLYSTSESRYQATSNLDVHFKTGLDITTKQGLISLHSINTSTHQQYGLGAIYIENGKLYVLQSTSTEVTNEICDIQINTDYHIESSITSNYSTYYLNGLKVKENDVYISTLTSYVAFAFPTYSPNSSRSMYIGVYRGASSVITAPFLGILYGNTNWGGEIVVSEGEIGWDDGTALINDAICQDDTNKITYLYQNNELININELPDQSGQSGKYLTTNGSSVSWANVDALPSQTGNSGKFLTTDGTSTSWATVSIPTVNNSTITIQKNSTTVDSFTLNQSSGKTINISVPTKTSDLTNDSGYTTNTGTVTSVQVQAGTGLASSTSTAQNTTLNTTISIASGYKLPTTTEWNNKQDSLPSQSGNSGKFLTTNGTTISWANVDALPSQSGQSGKYLTTNGTSVSWGVVNALPDQTSQSGKFLTTDGTTASWATVQAGPKFLSFTNVTASNWVSDSTYTGYEYKCILTCSGVTSSDYAQVIFGPDQANSGNYASVCLTGTNSVTIYSKVNISIVIPTIAIMGV